MNGNNIKIYVCPKCGAYINMINIKECNVLVPEEQECQRCGERVVPEEYKEEPQD